MRSKLFVPASRPELYSKAGSSDADALSFDLEDAVQEDRKPQARLTLAAHLRAMDASRSVKTLIVRVNAFGSDHFLRDIDAVTQGALDMINLPKVESAETVIQVAGLLSDLEKSRGLKHKIGILVNIESPLGLHRVADIAMSHPRITGLQIGFGDLFAPIGIVSAEPFATQHVRIKVKMAAAMAGIPAYDGAYVDIANPEGYRSDALAAYALGFAGKSCIHPTQIAIANEVFRPTRLEIEQARRVVIAAEEAKKSGIGAFVVDGRLVDGPFIAQAYQVLQRAVKLGNGHANTFAAQLDSSQSSTF